MRKFCRTPKAKCARCMCPYGAFGFHDMIVPDDVWAQISPSGNEGGLLCPTCILAAMDDLKLKEVPVWFASGPACISETARAEKYCVLWVATKEKLDKILGIIMDAKPGLDALKQE